MKKMKLCLILLAFIAMTGIANAGGVGYIDYLKVIDNYDYAKKVTKEVDAYCPGCVKSFFFSSSYPSPKRIFKCSFVK